ncbi:MAG: OprO/OprP family phosphate-selective porin [Puniceicoccales bacterium]|nr:OprO/OprP family phosphate-selective porin [Puniceicoccales bacterium]
MKSHNHTHTLAFLLAASAVAGATSLAAQDADSPAALREQIQQLDAQVQQLKILERNLELKSEAIEGAAKKLPAVSIDSKGFNVVGTDKAYSLKIGLLLQTDGRFFLDNGTETAAHRDTFLLRRVRLPISGTFAKIFSYNLTPEFAQTDTAGNNTQLVDAWIAATLSPEFSLKIGKFFGPVALESPNPRHFSEATFTNQLAPNRDLGLEAAGALFSKTFNYRLGLYNGAANNTWAESTNLADGDFSVGGRLTFSPFANSDSQSVKGLAFSVGGSYGHEAGSSGRIRTNGQQDLINPAAYTGDHARVAPALEWHVGPFSAIAEGLWEHWDRAGTANSVDNYGWRVNVGWVITGEDSTRRGVTPSSPFSWENGTWGAWEIVARVSGVEVDKEIRAKTNAFSYGVGINWYLTNNLQFRFDVEKTNFSRGITLKNELTAFSRLQVNF